MTFPKFLFEPKPREPVTILSTFDETGVPDKQAKLLQNIYDSVCRVLDREVFLLNFRISWAIVLSGGITATQAYILTYVKDKHPGQPSVGLLAQGALIVLSIMAVSFCYRSARGVVAAQSQTAEVMESFNRYKILYEKLKLPRPFGDKEAHGTGDYNAITFPVSLMWIWMAFAAVQLLYFFYLFRTLPLDATLSQCVRSLGECMTRLGI